MARFPVGECRTCQWQLGGEIELKVLHLSITKLQDVQAARGFVSHAISQCSEEAETQRDEVIYDVWSVSRCY